MLTLYYVTQLRNIEVKWMMTSFMLTLTTDVDMVKHLLQQKEKKIKVTNVTKCVIPMETHGRYACSRTVE